MPDSEDKKIKSGSLYKITRIFDSLLNKYASTTDEDFKDWQVTMFFLIFLCTTLFGTISCAISIALTIHIGKYQIALFYAVVYLTFVIVTFGRFLPFKIRAWTGISTYYIIGLINLIQIGPTGSGKAWLFVFALIACLTLGLRAGIVSLLMNTLTFFIIGLMLKFNLLSWQYSPEIGFSHWMTASITSIILCSTILIPLSIVVSFREKRLFEEIRLTDKLHRLNMQYKQEIIERKLIEKALGESEEKFSKAFKTSPAVMALIAVEDGCFVEINDKFEEVFGYSTEEFIGKTTQGLNIWVNNVEQAYFEETIKKMNAVKNVEISLFRKNGDIFQGLFSADKIMLKGKEYALTMLLDISDLKKSEKTLKNNNLYLGQLVGMQSKELCKVKFELEKTKAIATNLLDEIETYRDNIDDNAYDQEFFEQKLKKANYDL